MTFNFARQMQACVYAGTPSRSRSWDNMSNGFDNTQKKPLFLAAEWFKALIEVIFRFQIFTRKWYANASMVSKSSLVNLPSQHTPRCNLLTFALAPAFLFAPWDFVEAKQTPGPEE